MLRKVRCYKIDIRQLSGSNTDGLMIYIDTLDKTKVTGIEPVDKAQDGVNNLVTGQLGQGGALQGVGDTFSKEGMNRAERGGKDDSVSCCFQQS